ncbi:MAG: hypothetical protein QNI87_09510 [Erythrobacter sp.]|uniref:hypothetical protein n=1 Tax=Erythrobacter sp. TaxID=1042 RepID=UPI00260C486D|nr:hypothetical protein [Erythrobacter sp.]MDJ0978762.1 hypothetical protein [Erythrobacter sp.]
MGGYKSRALASALAVTALPPAALAHTEREPFAQDDSGRTQRESALIARNEDAFERIEEMCEDGCYTEFGIVEAAREPGAPPSIDGAFMLDVYRVQKKPYSYSLHSLDRYDPTCVIIQIDKDIMAQLLDRFEWEAQFLEGSDDEIVVARRKKLKKATLEGANEHFAGRRIVIRGQTRLIRWPWEGQKRGDQVVIKVESADDLVRVPILRPRD